jgi:hypothetical protein
MGFYRHGTPQALDRAAATAAITRLVAEEVAFASRTADPFLIAHDCRNPAGHSFIGSCGDVACRHCGMIAWA